MHDSQDDRGLLAALASTGFDVSPELRKAITETPHVPVFTPDQHIDKLKEALAWRVRTCATQHIDPIRDPMACALIYAIGTIQREQSRRGDL